MQSSAHKCVRIHCGDVSVLPSILRWSGERIRQFPQRLDHGITVAQWRRMANRWGIDDRFNRFQEFILGLRAGDAVQIEDLAQTTGLSEGLCRRSLEALAAVGVMSNEYDGRFVRRTRSASAL
jgi:hypothetical protein